MARQPARPTGAWRITFRVTLTVVFLSLLSLSALAIGLTSFYFGRENATELSSRVLEQASGRIELHVRALIDVARSQSTINRNLIRSGQLRLSACEGGSEALEITSSDFPTVADYFAEVMRVHDELAYLSLAIDETDEYCVLERRGHEINVRHFRRDADGDMEILEYSKPPSTVERPPYRGYLPTQRSWYKAAVDEKEQTWHHVYVFWGVDEGSTTPGISCATPIYGPDPRRDAKGRERPACVLTADYELRDLSAFLRDEVRVGGSGTAFIVETLADGSRQVVAHPRPELLVEMRVPPEPNPFYPPRPDGKEPLLRSVDDFPDAAVRAFAAHLPVRFPTGEDVVSLAFDVGGEPYFGSYQHLGGEVRPNWTVCTVMPESDILASVHRNNVVNLMIGLGAFSLTALICVLVSSRVSRPLGRLVQENQRVGRFDLQDDDLGRSRIKEVDQLLVATEDMKTSLRSFGKYVPAALVRELLASGDEAKLGGQRATLTVYFSDIQDFTSIAEALPPEELVDHLGEYLGATSEEIHAERGTIDKYIGDAVMAFWGAPVRNPEHAQAACRAALANRRRLRELDARWRRSGRPALETRIGISTGPLVVGNMGSAQRMDYTVIGNTVNLASRLEGLNKVYGTQILVSQDTHEALEGAFVTRPVDRVAVKGRTEGVVVYELLALSEDADAADLDLAHQYAAALEVYLEGRWEEAVVAFAALHARYPTDGPTAVLLDRCRRFRAHPPDAWDGVYRPQVK